MHKALNLIKDLCLVINFNSYWKPRVDEAIAELEEAMKPKTCDGCKTLPFVLTELAKKNGGKCGTCKRYVKDNYEAEPKDNA